MFIDKIGLNPFETNAEKSASTQNTNSAATPVIKRTYSFVGCNDVDETDTADMTFDESEINNSLEKAGANNDNATYQVKTTGTKSSSSASTTEIDTELTDILSQILTAQQNEDFTKANTLMTTYNNLLATRPETGIDTAQISEINKEISSLETQLSTLANEKYTQMQINDEYGQYTTEQKENTINEQLKELKIKRYNLERGGKVSAEELSILAYSLDCEFRLSRITEKRNYITYKSNEIAQQKELAIKNEDEYQQYILEQQENAINALDKILEMDEDNIRCAFNATNTKINILNSEPIKSTDNNNADKKSLLETLKKQQELSYKTIQLASEKSIAMQNEDDQQMTALAKQEDEINEQDKELEITKQKLVAKLNGTELTDSEINSISKKYDCEVMLAKIQAKRQYINYKLIQIASANTTAMQNEDEYAQYNLEQYSDKLMIADDKLDTVCAKLEQALSDGSDAALDSATALAKEYENIDISEPYSSYKYKETGNGTTTTTTTRTTTATTTTTQTDTEEKQVDRGGVITIGSTNTSTVKADEKITENDGTFSFKGKKLYRNGQKYTGEFEGKMYKKGKLYTGTKDGIYYKKGVKYNGTRREFLKKAGKHRYVYGKYKYADGVLAEGEVDGKMYHEGKLLTGLATYTPYKEDGKTVDTTKAVTTYYKKGVKGTGKYKGLFYVNGELFTGTYKNKTYVNGVKQK